MEDRIMPAEDQPSKAEIHEGSATQGGSNFGQGSSQLGKKSARQGSEKNAGADYANESGWNNEAMHSSDLEENAGRPKTNHDNDPSK